MPPLAPRVHGISTRRMECGKVVFNGMFDCVVLPVVDIAGTEMVGDVGHVCECFDAVSPLLFSLHLAID